MKHRYMLPLYLMVCFSIGALTSAIAQATQQQLNYNLTYLSGQTYTPISGGTVINDTMQLSAGQDHNADDGTVLVTLPFAFNYNGRSFTQVTFCTNGWIAMGDQTMTVSTAQSRSYGSLYSMIIPKNCIAAWYKDGNANFPGVGSMVHGTIGTGVYALEWRKAVAYGYTPTATNLINYMIKLYGPASATPGRIEICYGSDSGNVEGGAGIGIKDSVGGMYHFMNAADTSINTTMPAYFWPGSGEVIRFDPPQPCSGAPNAGTVSAPVNTCAGAMLSLTASGYSNALGIGLQWQSSPAGQNNWMNITGATTSMLTTSQTAATDYRMRATCNGANPAYSNVVSVAMKTTGCAPLNNEPCYATPLTVSSNANCSNMITGTTALATISTGLGYINPVGCNAAYGPKDVWYTVKTDSTGVGSTMLNFKISKAAGSAMNTANMTLFSATGSCPSMTLTPVSGGCNSANSNLSTLVMMANNLTPNTTYYLRVSPYYSSDSTGAFDLCAYLPPPLCSGTPAGGTAVSSATDVCLNTSFTVSVNNGPVASGLSYQWQTSADNITWNNLFNGTGETYTVPGITSAHYYRRMVKCGTDSAYSSVVMVSMSAAAQCYCSPANGVTLHSSSFTPSLESVSITGTTLNSANAGSSANGYTQFPATGNTTATLQQGGTYTLLTSMSDTCSASVWIDWNRNGVYEPTEWKQITQSAASGTTSIVVPTNASLGVTGMRIRTRLTTSNTAQDACTQFYSGETEQYFITIAAATPCTGTPTGVTVNGPAQACTGSVINLAANNFTYASGLHFQWQSSPAGQNNWSNMTGDTMPTVTVSQTAAKDYKVVLTCNGANPVSSSTLSVAMQTTACPPVNDNPCGAITLLVSADTSCANKLVGTTALATTSAGFGYTNPVGCSIGYSPKDVWYKVTTAATGAGSTGIHFRLARTTSSTMTTATMMLFAAGGNCPQPLLTYQQGACRSSTYNFPPFIMKAGNLQPNTTYYLRISPSSDADPTGEFEICAYTPPPTQPCVTKTYPLGNDTVPINVVTTLTWKAAPNATEYDLYLGDTYPPAYYSTIYGDTTETKTFAAYNRTYYWQVVPNTIYGSTAVCDIDSFVTQMPPANCIPMTSFGCTMGDTLKLFSLLGEDSTQIYNPSGCSTGGYGDYTSSTPVKLRPGNAYAGTFMTSFQTNYVTIWIDFDNNGIFSNSERLLNNLRVLGKNVLTPYAINIPASAPLGNHRLRVRNIYWSYMNVNATDACNFYTFSETEDYTVVIDTSTTHRSFVSRGMNNNCMAVGALTVDDSTNNSNRFINIVDEHNQLVASINANGNNLGAVQATVYKNVGAVRSAGGTKLLDRNITITPEHQPTSPVLVRLYFTDDELGALKSADPMVMDRSYIDVTKTPAGCDNSNPVPVNGMAIPQAGNGAYGSDHYIDVVVTSFSTFYLNRGNRTLPVTMMSLSGERKGTVNMLTWRTATEANNMGFELQRSADGSHYGGVVFVPSKGRNGNSTSALSYAYTDEKPIAGNCYYRLKQVDKDGRFTYSNIVLIKGAKANDVMLTSLYPNPVSHSMNVVINAPVNDKLTLMITDMAGKVVKQQQVQVVSGDNNVGLDASAMPRGTYFIKAVCASGCSTAVKKFVKE